MENALSSLRSRRFSAKKQEETRQIIAFKLFYFRFALPILDVEKVISLNEKDDNNTESKSKYIEYRDRELLLIDVAQVIFKDKVSSKDSLLKQSIKLQYVVILATNSQYNIGLPIDSQPIMYRPKISDFQPISQSNLQIDKIQCIDDEIINLPDLPPILLLNKKQVIDSCT